MVSTNSSFISSHLCTLTRCHLIIFVEKFPKVFTLLTIVDPVESDRAYWPQRKVAGVHLCRSPPRHSEFSAVTTVSLRFISTSLSGFLAFFHSEQTWGVFIFLQSRIDFFPPLFVLYHYKEIASILQLQPAAAGTCEECYNPVFLFFPPLICVFTL